MSLSLRSLLRRIIPRYSFTVAAAPTDIAEGEIVTNFLTEKLYIQGRGSILEIPSLGIVTDMIGDAVRLPWNFSPTEPARTVLWWEIGGDGLPLYPWPWRWFPGPQKWVSDRQYLVSGTGGGSTFRSGTLTDDFPLGIVNIFVERIDIQFFLNTGVSAVNWLLEIRETNASLTESTWQSFNMSGAPLSATRNSSIPLNQLRQKPVNGWAWKVSPVTQGGSFEFKTQIYARMVRA